MAFYTIYESGKKVGQLEESCREYLCNFIREKANPLSGRKYRIRVNPSATIFLPLIKLAFQHSALLVMEVFQKPAIFISTKEKLQVGDLALTLNSITLPGYLCLTPLVSWFSLLLKVNCLETDTPRMAMYSFHKSSVPIQLIASHIKGYPGTSSSHLRYLLQDTPAFRTLDYYFAPGICFLGWLQNTRDISLLKEYSSYETVDGFISFMREISKKDEQAEAWCDFAYTLTNLFSFVPTLAHEHHQRLIQQIQEGIECM